MGLVARCVDLNIDQTKTNMTVVGTGAKLLDFFALVAASLPDIQQIQSKIQGKGISISISSTGPAFCHRIVTKIPSNLRSEYLGHSCLLDKIILSVCQHI